MDNIQLMMRKSIFDAFEETIQDTIKHLKGDPLEDRRIFENALSSCVAAYRKKREARDSSKVSDEEYSEMINGIIIDLMVKYFMI